MEVKEGLRIHTSGILSFASDKRLGSDKVSQLQLMSRFVNSNGKIIYTLRYSHAEETIWLVFGSILRTIFNVTILIYPLNLRIQSLLV